MLTQIDVVYGNELGEQALALPILGVTPRESLLIRKVTGLNPADIGLFIGEYARDGGSYQGRRVGNRNVVMTIDLNPNPALGETISGLRDLLYKTFVDPLVDADHVELVLHSDDGRVRNLFGYTEKFETEIFDIETMAQISMICPDPYIRDLTETVLTNPSGTWLTVPFTYGGTAETGFYAQINMSADAASMTITNNGKSMVFTYPFLTGDIIYLDTQRGQRSAVVVRGGTTTPLLAYMSVTSPWIELHSQTNTMTVSTGSGVKTLKYRAAYWGV